MFQKKNLARVSKNDSQRDPSSTFYPKTQASTVANRKKDYFQTGELKPLDGKSLNVRREEAPTDRRHVIEIIFAVPCDVHDAWTGEACWIIEPEMRHSLRVLSICNHRAKKAGFDGDIDPHSLRVGRPAPKFRKN